MGLHLRLWLIFAAAALPARAEFTSSSCPDVQLSADDFVVAELFNKQGGHQAAKDSMLTEPVHMDVRVVNDPSKPFTPISSPAGRTANCGSPVSR